jgi:membrane protein implicated in regulation of membrane protease activity
MYPNSALSAWQLAIVAVVPLAALVAWLTAIFLAAREPRGQDLAAAGSPAESATAVTGEREPEQQAPDRMAA